MATIGFGTYRLNGHTYEAVLTAIKTGYTFFDTAPLYKNEDQVGKAIRNSGKNRNNFYITTKISRDSLQQGSIVESIETSLRTMGLDYIDEVILHEPINYVDNWIKLYEFYTTRGRNLVKYIGVSNFNETHLQDILTFGRPHVNQIELNPFLTRSNLVNYCIKNDIQIVAHSPLAKGEKLTNPILKSIGIRYTASPAQTMLAWGLQKGYRVIPRSHTPEHIQENICSLTLDPFEISILDSLDCGYATHPKYICPA